MKLWIVIGTLAIALMGCGKGKSEDRNKADDGTRAKSSAIPTGQPPVGQPGDLPATPVARPDHPEEASPSSDPATAVDTRGATPGAPAAAKPASGEPAPDLDPGGEPADTCVTDCVQRNQMRAVGPEQIESDCRAECAKKGE